MWDWWVDLVDFKLEEAHDDRLERMEILLHAINKWRDFLHASRWTRWQVSSALLLPQLSDLCNIIGSSSIYRFVGDHAMKQLRISRSMSQAFYLTSLCVSLPFLRQVLETALEIAVKERRAADREIEMMKLTGAYLSDRVAYYLMQC